MYVEELWRYPVKSLAGERLEEAEVTAGGIRGDRVVHVQQDGRVLTARRFPRLLGLHARLGADGEPWVEDQPWSAPEVAAQIQRAAGAGAVLKRYDGLERFDVLPLLIVTDGAIDALGVDRRRLRPNIVVAGVPDLSERQWPRRHLRIGPVLIRVAKVRRRCVMTTFDPDTQEQDPTVLRRIVRDFGGTIGLDCDVVEPGRIAVGDPVALEDAR